MLRPEPAPKLALEVEHSRQVLLVPFLHAPNQPQERQIDGSCDAMLEAFADNHAIDCFDLRHSPFEHLS